MQALSELEKSGIDLQVVRSDGQFVEVSLCLPSSLLPVFRSMASSFHEMANFVALKARHEKAMSDVLDLDIRLKRDNAILDRDKRVLSFYDEFRSIGLDHKESIKSTKQHFPMFNCYQIGLIVKNQKGSLKKVGTV